METTPTEGGRVQGFAFDPYAPGFDANPHAVFRYMREKEPVHWWSAARGWVVTGYDDVSACLRDRRLSCDYRDWEHATRRTHGAPASAYELLMEHGLFALAEGDHTRLRKLVSPAFTPRAIETMREDTQSVVDEALKRVSGTDRLDIAADVAANIPLRVIARMLRIPRELDSAFRSFALAVVELTSSPWLSPEAFTAGSAVVSDGVALLESLIDERRVHALGDLLSKLVQVEEQGDRLSTRELVSLVAALVVAGAETTVHLINFGVLNLLRHPDQLRLIRKDPSLLKNAIEEVLRYDMFGKTGLMRYAREDIQIRGTRIREGQMIAVVVASALRDPNVFPEPDRFDIRRDMSASIAFGSGVHYCLGAALARLEAHVALETLLLRRYPHMQLAGEPTFAPHASLRRMRSLPVMLREG